MRYLQKNNTGLTYSENGSIIVLCSINSEYIMQALLETTDWPYANHTYLLDGNNLVAYIKKGELIPFYFKNPIKGFDKRGRKFVELEHNPFDTSAKQASEMIREVLGSKGNKYFVNLEEHTCTCPGYTFRGTCKHVKELETV
jgi:hypothetical protein